MVEADTLDRVLFMDVCFKYYPLTLYFVKIHISEMPGSSQ